ESSVHIRLLGHLSCNHHPPRIFPAHHPFGCHYLPECYCNRELSLFLSQNRLNIRLRGIIQAVCLDILRHFPLVLCLLPAKKIQPPKGGHWLRLPCSWACLPRLFRA